MSTMVRWMLLSWQGLLGGKKHVKVLRVTLLHLFWAIWKKMNHRAFVNEDQLDQALKNSFMCSLWIWVRKSLDRVFMSILDFVDWLGSY